MIRHIRPSALMAIVCMVTAIEARGAGNETLPLADLHFHADQAQSPESVLEAMDRAGVRWAGNGPKGADPNWRAYVEAARDRFIPFGGQGAIGTRVQQQGEAAWNLKSADLDRYLGALEQGLREKRLRGIGELFVNNMHTHAPTFQPTRYPADSPLMRRLFSLAVTYHVPLSVHMEADPSSIEELERLLATDRNGIVIWAHCGFWIEGRDVQAMMDRNPILMCELSHRDDRRHNPRLRAGDITGAGRTLKPEWKTLLEKHSDRFLIGTDVDDPGQYADIIAFYRVVLAQLSPEAAGRLANGNAIRLFGLSR